MAAGSPSHRDPPHPVFRDPPVALRPLAPAPGSDRAVTQRATARAPARSAWCGHSPVGGARRAGGAADRGSSRGRPRASPSRPAAPRQDTRRQRQLRGMGTQLAPSLPPRPAATSSRPPAPSFFPGSNRHLPSAPRPRRLLFPSSPPTVLPANGSARRGRLADRAGSQSRGGIARGKAAPGSLRPRGCRGIPAERNA